MAFKPLARYGDPVKVRKPNERLVVQQVELTNMNGGDARQIIDFRVQYEKEETWLPSKVGFAIDTRESIENLMDILQGVLDDEDMEWNSKPPQSVVAQDEPPKKTVKRRKRTKVA